MMPVLVKILAKRSWSGKRLPKMPHAAFITSFCKKEWGGTAVARERRAAGGINRSSVLFSVMMGTATRTVYFGLFPRYVPQKASLISEILPPLALALVSDAIIRRAPIATGDALIFATCASWRQRELPHESTMQDNVVF